MATVDAADDHPTDHHVSFDPSHFTLPSNIEQVHVPDSVLDTGAVESVKITTAHDKENSSPLASSRGASLSASHDPASDAASVHSMPAVHISEPPPPPARRPSTAAPTATTAVLSGRPASTLPHYSAPQSETTSAVLSQQQRRARHRSAIEVRSSNRFSGFFNNLIHRRESALPSPARETIEEDQDVSKQDADNGSRPPSPAQAQVSPPPPSLPPPSLQELGLSLSIVTSDLSPAHFSTPPSSGAFLAPHYLLLCHAQGLDVLPLTSPPVPQPYALVRRVAFKSVVVMEHRGVLVAIAGRRDGVRVYALEEVKKAIEWRIDVEIRRERERLRREAAKRPPSRPENELRDSGEKFRKASLSTPPPTDNLKAILRKSSHGSLPCPPSSPPAPLVPRAPRTPTRSRRKSRVSSIQMQQPRLDASDPPAGQPPPYPSSPDVQPLPVLRSQPSALSVRARARSNSVSNVLAGVSVLTRNGEASISLENHSKSDDWAGSSDDEAIDIRAAASGSQVLDERTSATLAASRNASSTTVAPQPSSRPRSSTNSSRRHRPSNLDLSGARATDIPDSQPSPAPTLLTLRQALQQFPNPQSPDPFDDADDDEDENDGRISLAQALSESRIPELPPPGTVQPQEAILLSAASSALQDTSSPRSSEGDGPGGREQSTSRSRNRRGWSVMLSGSSSLHRSSSQRLTSSSSHNLVQSSHLGPTTPSHQNQTNTHSSRSPSLRSNTMPIPTERSSASADPFSSTVSPQASILPSSTNSLNPRSSRFIPRIISNALGRRSDERLPPTISAIDADTSKWLSVPPPPPPAPPPKLEYVKLPGTKGALMIKAVETQKKSFLAILCGDNGEKVELFAGTYRTALGLSRTFILPDSPRSLELQLQGDDLVEVFLVFAQNVFGLEPATVRVREVRIGRAERRAARRRARENRTGEVLSADHETNEDDINAGISLGVSVTVTSGDGPTRPSTPPLIASEHPDAPDESRVGHSESIPPTPTLPADELAAVATTQMGPYTTFQQLSFAPHFPLASIADEYIIPPTYPTFCSHRDQNEQVPDNNNGLDPVPTQFSPPGLPIPTPLGPTQWYYKDPKGVMHGPWPSNLMQAWYRDGLLPPDLPVRREGETEYTLLRDLKLQCVDPASPFRSPLPPITSVNTFVTPPKPLLPPISLLSQPKHFGPPALFFSSRGGHSTAIVDTRGRSVLKGRFVWSNEEALDEAKVPVGKMGDVRHLEALDVKDRSVLVAMRQGGIEAVDLSDALLRPADESRTMLPAFHAPVGTINRRPPFVWKIGTPVNTSSAPLSALSSKVKPGAPKKTGIGITKTTSASQGSTGADVDCDPNDEVLFLGRKEDEIYYCERNAGSFRILRLSPRTNE